MALDLSRIETRSDNQRRLTSNRDAVLPTRRDTDAPRLEVNADLRSASRGDGGAQALLRMFGGIEEAAQSFEGYLTAKQAKQNQDLAVQGAAAQSMGIENPELEKRHKAYAVAVSVGNGVKGVYDQTTQIDGLIEAALAEPEHPADLDDIDQIIEGGFREYAVVDGKLRDFGTNEAKLAVGKAITEATSKLREKYRAVIVDQVNQKSIDTASFNATQSLASGAFDFEGALAQISPGVPRANAKAAIINSAQDYALSVVEKQPDRAMEVLDTLLTSKRADGTPSLSADEREKLRTERIRMGAQAEAAKVREEAKLHEEQSDKLLDRFNRVPGSGTYPSVTEVLQLRSQNKIGSEQANSLVSMIRADKEMNGAGTVNSGSGSTKFDPDKQPVANDILARAYRGEISTSAARSLAMRMAAAGNFGAGENRYKTLSNLRQNLGVIDSMDQGVRTEVGNALKVWHSDAKQLLARLPQAKRNAALRELDDTSKMILNRAVKDAKEGKDPMAVAKAGMTGSARAMIATYGLGR